MRPGLPRLLRSRRLALALLIATAALAVFGTLPLTELVQGRFAPLPGILPAARALGLVDTYRSPLFILLVGALGVSIVTCTWQRIFPLPGAPAGDPAGGWRRTRRTLDALVHLSLLAIVAGGAAKGLFGFVRTKNIHVGQSTDVFYDFGSAADVPLGFTLEVLDRVDTYYPLQALIGVSDRADGRKIDLVEVWEGRAVLVQAAGLTLELGAPDGEGKMLHLRTTVDGRAGAAELAFVAEGVSSTADVGTLRLALVAWRRELKGVRTRLACRENGVRTREGWVSPQGRVTCGGVSFAQTAWGVDEFGNRFTGIQAVREPAAPLFWGGCVVFVFALPLFLAVRAAGTSGSGRSGGKEDVVG